MNMYQIGRRSLTGTERLHFCECCVKRVAGNGALSFKIRVYNFRINLDCKFYIYIKYCCVYRYIKLKMQTARRINIINKYVPQICDSRGIDDKLLARIVDILCSKIKLLYYLSQYILNLYLNQTVGYLVLMAPTFIVYLFIFL